MEKLVCPRCNKVIEGYNHKHVEMLMMQHQFKHRYEDKHSKDHSPQLNPKEVNASSPEDAIGKVDREEIYDE